MSNNKDRLTYRPEPEAKQKIERWYQEDNCRSKNEFIEKAVNCYADMLAVDESTTLPYLCLLRRNFCTAGGTLFWFQQRKFCITEGVLFGYSGAIFERSKVSFH